MILEDAYRATAYHVDGPGGRFTLRIGTACPQADALLERLDAACWVFVTASNPGSVRLPAAENGQRHDRLVAEVTRRGWQAWPGEGVGDDGAWPAEVSLFVVGATEPEAHDLGRAFGQHAVVCGALGGGARLCWLSGTGVPPGFFHGPAGRQSHPEAVRP